MNRMAVITIPVLLLFLISCNLFNSESNNVPEWYPSTWTYDQSKMEEFSNTYSDFLQTFHVNQILYEHFDTLCSHIFSYGSRDITLLCTEENETERIAEFEQNFLIFYKDWWRLFSAESLRVDEIDASIHNGALSARIYPKSNYLNPLESPEFDLGRIQIGVDNEGYLETLWSSLIPHLPVPDHASVSLNDAKDILEGYSFTIDAFLYQLDVTLSREDLSSSGLITYIENNSQNRFGYIKYRLVWSFRVQDGNVYVDALTGEILGYRQTTIYM